MCLAKVLPDLPMPVSSIKQWKRKGQSTTVETANDDKGVKGRWPAVS